MFRLSRHTLYSQNKFLDTTALRHLSNILFVWLPPNQPSLSFFHKDKVLDAELSPAVLPVDHGSQRYCGGPVTEAHIRHMRKKAHIPFWVESRGGQRGHPCAHRDRFSLQSFRLRIQVNSSHIECHLGGFKHGYFQRIETWTLSKKSKFCFGTTIGVCYWVNLSETLFDSSTGQTARLVFVGISLAVFLCGLQQLCTWGCSDLVSCKQGYARERVTPTLWIWRMIHTAYPPVNKINKDKHRQKTGKPASHLQFANQLISMVVLVKYMYVLILCNGPVTL